MDVVAYSAQCYQSTKLLPLVTHRVILKEHLNVTMMVLELFLC